MSFLRRAFEQRDIGHLPTAIMGNPNVPPNWQGGLAETGIPVTDQTALNLTVFYSCVRLLADSIASLPWDAFRKGDVSRIQVNPQPSLLRSPAPDMTEFDWKHILMVSLCIRGNFYGLVTARDQLEYPTSIVPLHPDFVRLDRDPRTMQRRVWVGGNPEPMENLFHIPAFRIPGHDVGLSPVMMARHSLGLGLAAQEYGAKWFRDGAAPSSVLETDQDLQEDQVQRVQKHWVTSHGGRRRPAVLSGGFKWRPITITPEESQFLQTRQHQAFEIAQMFGIPPHMLGIMDKTTSWGTGIEQQSIGYATYTLRPWLTRIEAALSNVLPRGQFVKFNVDGLLRGDVKTRYEAYRIAIDGGWRNPDEVRALEDLPPIPGGAGAKYRQPMNFMELGADPTPKPAPAPPPVNPNGGPPDDSAA